MRRTALPLAWMVVAALAAACRAAPPNKEMRFWTDDLRLTVSSDPSPPYARESTLYKVVVRDKKTDQPIENGEGRIFASTRQGANVWDNFIPGRELGTYYGKLNYVVAGQWAVAIQFRRDSTKALERMDWMQDVQNAR